MNEKKERGAVATARTYIKKTWYFLWYEDSLLSWIVSILVAFLFIKFLLYPGLGLVFGTQFPIVAVVSNSMEHDGSFAAWWPGQEQFYLRHNITERDFKEYPFANGFNKGDIMILVGTAPKKLERGEILVFWSGKPYPIIHRIVGIRTQGDARVFSTKGDHNADQVKMPPILDETDIAEEQVIGRAIARIPYLGYVKILFVDLVNLLLGNAPSA